jgi:hypothetical protein
MDTLNPLLPYVNWAIPALLTVWYLSPFCGRETKLSAGRNALYSWWPKTSADGNNPASQRVHEKGGLRFFGLFVAVPVQALIGLASPDWVSAVIFQVLVLLPAMYLTERVIDIAEHSAEVLHADKNGWVPQVQLWLNAKSFTTYRQGECWRMTRRHQDFEDMTPTEFNEAMRSKEWMAKIILLLARLP